MLDLIGAIPESGRDIEWGHETAPKARLALAFAHAPREFLATVQVGITLIGILAGALGGATLAQSLAVFLRRVP
jgi:putative hemolysin